MRNVQYTIRKKKKQARNRLFLWLGSCHLSSSPLENLGDYINIISSSGSLIFKIVNDILKFCFFYIKIISTYPQSLYFILSEKQQVLLWDILTNSWK